MHICIHLHSHTYTYLHIWRLRRVKKAWNSYGCMDEWGESERVLLRLISGRSVDLRFIHRCIHLSKPHCAVSSSIRLLLSSFPSFLSIPITCVPVPFSFCHSHFARLQQFAPSFTRRPILVRWLAEIFTAAVAWIHIYAAMHPTLQHVTLLLFSSCPLFTLVHHRTCTRQADIQKDLETDWLTDRQWERDRKTDRDLKSCMSIARSSTHTGMTHSRTN